MLNTIKISEAPEMMTTVCKITSITNLLANRLVISKQDTVARLVSSSAKSRSGVPSPSIPPKKPPTPFLVYAKDQRHKVSEQFPDLKSNDLLRRISSNWKVLPEDAKKDYVDTFIQRMQIFKVDEKKWWEGLSPDQKEEYAESKKLRSTRRAERRLRTKMRTLGRPVRARSAFNYYVSEHLKKKVEAGHKNRFSSLSESWRGISDQDKQVYVEMAEKDRQRYLGEMSAWELRMMRSGHSDVVRHSTAKTVKQTKKPKKDATEPGTNKKSP